MAGEQRETITITEHSTPAIGSLVVNDNRSITYMPDVDETGSDEISYTATMTDADNSVITEVGRISVIVTEPEVTHPVADHIYYVTTAGKSTNDGATEETAWEIKHAFQTAKPGDVVHIKAGQYGAVNAVVGRSGTENEPIKFIGYKEKPGDIRATAGSTFKYEESVYSPADYPTLEGVRTDGKVTGTGIEIKQKYIEVHNVQIKNKSIGIRSQGSYNKLNNVIILEMGNYTGYSGFGVIMSGNYNEFTNSFIKNGVELFSSSGSHQLIDNNWLGCDQDINNDYSTDYYLLLFGNSGKSADHNTVNNNTIYRQPKQYHQALSLAGIGMGLVPPGIMSLKTASSPISKTSSSGPSVPTAIRCLKTVRSRTTRQRSLIKTANVLIILSLKGKKSLWM